MRQPGQRRRPLVMRTAAGYRDRLGQRRGGGQVLPAQGLKLSTIGADVGLVHFARAEYHREPADGGQFAGVRQKVMLAVVAVMEVGAARQGGGDALWHLPPDDGVVAQAGVEAPHTAEM